MGLPEIGLIGKFISLFDTPNDYTGYGGYLIGVKADVTGVEFVSAGSLTIDHGGLTGLGDDDHSQYHNDARADIWLATKDITDLGTYSHTSLTDIGTYTHGTIDTHIDDGTIHYIQSAISIPLSQVNDVTATAAEVNLLDLAGLTAGWVLSADTATTASWKAQVAGMVYPEAGIALSTGSAWGTSITDNSANWNTAFGWGDHVGLYEDDLGNPASDGYLLSSTAVGVRSWTAPTAGATTYDLSLGTGLSFSVGLGTDLVLTNDATIALEAGLQSLAGLTYVSTAFVKMTGADTFTLDTSTYNDYTHPDHTGHVTSSGDGATTLTVSAITGQTELTTGLVSTDELLLSDGGVISRMDISVIQTYMQDNLSFGSGSLPTATVDGTMYYYNGSAGDIIDPDYMFWDSTNNKLRFTGVETYDAWIGGASRQLILNGYTAIQLYFSGSARHSFNRYYLRPVDTNTATLGTSANIWKHIYLGAGTTTEESIITAGALKIGAHSSTTPVAGTVEYDGTNYRGYHNSAWVNLDAQGGSPTTYDLSLGTGLSFSVGSGTDLVLTNDATISLHANLQSLAGLSYVSASFVKMTAAGTFSLDTSTLLTNPMTTAGDIIYGGASGTPTRLAGAGTDDWMLYYDTGTDAPYWAAAPSGSLPTATTDGEMYYYNGAAGAVIDYDYLFWDDTNNRLRFTGVQTYDAWIGGNARQLELNGYTAIRMYFSGTNRFLFTAGYIRPVTNEYSTLGTSGNVWKHLYLGAGTTTIEAAIIAGAVTIGSHAKTTPDNGTIEYDGTNFRGYHNGWVNLDTQ